MFLLCFLGLNVELRALEGSLGYCLKQIFSQANSYCVKRRQGIISSFHRYSEDDNAKCLWIHHWVILQFIHPYFRVGPGDDLLNEGYFIFKHDNWNQFISLFDEAANQNYAEEHGDAPRFGLLWLGRRLVHEWRERMTTTTPPLVDFLLNVVIPISVSAVLLLLAGFVVALSISAVKDFLK